MVVPANFFQRGGLAEARNVRIPIIALPTMIGLCNFAGIFLCEIAQYTVLHVTLLPRINEEKLTFTVSPFTSIHSSLLLVLRKKPDTGGNLGVCEELPGQGDHALY